MPMRGKHQAPLAQRAAAAALSRRKHPERVNARNRLLRAVYAGKIQRPGECSRCGLVGTPEGSHDDYSKPLEVEWLCRSCHAKKDGPMRRKVA